MRIRTCITQAARARGMTAAEIARRLGWHRSNLSAADAGRRAMSLRALGRIADVLACSPAELIERAEARPSIFRSVRLDARLAARDAGLADGAECSWVHAVALAWQRHYRRRR